jgi:hypothetical protein
MQADAGFLNHVQAGPPLAQAFRMEAAKKPGGRPGRLGTLVLLDRPLSYQLIRGRIRLSQLRKSCLRHRLVRSRVAYDP